MSGASRALLCSPHQAVRVHALTIPTRWPVIAVIIIGVLIVISVIWCCARCLCCGLSCCCECCHCLKCCGQCCGCCDPPGGRRRKHLDEPYKNLPSDQGYQREDPMSAGALPFNRPAAPAKAEPPQYASFDVSKKSPEGDDALPAMPTWGDAEDKKIGIVEEEVELQQLKPEGNGQGAPLMNGMSPAPTPGTRTPVQGGMSPYGPPGSQAASSVFLGGAPGGTPGASPYNNMPGQGYDQMHNGYGQSTTSFHTEQSWGVTGGGPMGQEYGGQGHPQAGFGQHGYAQEPVNMQYGDQAAFSEYGGSNGTMGPGGYGRPVPSRSMTGGSNAPGMPKRSLTGGSSAASMAGGPPPQYPDRSRGSPAPSQGAFTQDRQFDPRIAPARTYSPAPQQQQGQFAGVPPPRTYSPAPQQQQSQFPGGPPPRTFSPAPGPGGPQRTYSPAPNGPRGPGPQRQWSGDTAGPGRTYSPGPGGPRGPPQPRAPPYRQYSTDSAPPPRQFSESPRPMAGNRPAPQRQYTTGSSDVPPGPRSPNFSRPTTRSNTADGGYGGEQAQEEPSGAYPGYKPYQPGR